MLLIIIHLFALYYPEYTYAHHQKTIPSTYITCFSLPFTIHSPKNHPSQQNSVTKHKENALSKAFVFLLFCLPFSSNIKIE